MILSKYGQEYKDRRAKVAGTQGGASVVLAGFRRKERRNLRHDQQARTRTKTRPRLDYTQAGGCAGCGTKRVDKESGIVRRRRRKVEQMTRKKRERGNGQGTVAPRRNKSGKVISFVGAFFGPDGKRHWVSAKTKTECWRKLNTAMVDADRGILPGPANLMVERYLTAWLADSVKGTVSRATYDGYRRDVHHHIIPELGRRKLKELTAGDIRRLYRKMAESGLKDRSIEYVHTTLRKSLKAAVVDKLINLNPTDDLKPLKTSTGAAKESKALNHYQVKALLEAASESRLEALYV